MKKYVSDCNECKEQKKASVCRECHNYWMGKLDEAIDSRASAIGKLGAYKTNFLKAQAGEKKVIADFVELQHENTHLGLRVESKDKVIKANVKWIADIIGNLDDSRTAHDITKKYLTSEKSKNDVLLNAIYKIKAFCEAGTKLFAWKTAINMIWKKTDQAIGRVTED